MPNTPDNLQAAGAADLARAISDFWVKRGYDANSLETRIEPQSVSGHSANIWVVRSNMRNGFPRRSGDRIGWTDGDYVLWKGPGNGPVEETPPGSPAR